MSQRTDVKRFKLPDLSVSFLPRSLAADPTLPDGTRVYSTLPITLDTPMNRKFMPDADHSAWTPLSFVAELMHKWTSDPTSRLVFYTQPCFEDSIPFLFLQVYFNFSFFYTQDDIRVLVNRLN